jgi:hypothetical protein
MPTILLKLFVSLYGIAFKAAFGPLCTTHIFGRWSGLVDQAL